MGLFVGRWGHVIGRRRTALASAAVLVAALSAGPFASVAGAAPPSVPKALTVTTAGASDLGTGDTPMTVSWGAPASGTPVSYEVQVCVALQTPTTGAGACTPTSTTPLTTGWVAASNPSVVGLSATENCPPGGNTCSYRVHAFDGVAYGPYTAPATYKPWSPFHVLAQSGPGLGEVTVTFDGPTETGAGANTAPKHYQLYVCDFDATMDNCGTDAQWSDTGISLNYPPPGAYPYAMPPHYCGPSEQCRYRLLFVNPLASPTRSSVPSATGPAQTATGPYDVTPPTSAFSLTSATNASITGTTLYYRKNVAGSFVLVDTVTDGGSGPASATFPAISGFGHPNETVTTPPGGPYSSSPYSWAPNPAAPTAPQRTITAADVAGNTTATTLTFTPDIGAPSQAISFPAVNGLYTTGPSWNTGCSSSICGTASDALSGVQTVEVSIQQGAGNYWDGAAFASPTAVWNVATGTTSWALPFPGSNFPADGAYTVSVRATDAVGNVQAPTSRSFTIDATAPTVTSVVLANANGTVQKLDTVSVVFDEKLKVASMCSAWSGDNAPQDLMVDNDVAVTITDGGAGNDVLTVTSATCTFNFGSVDLGTPSVVTATTSFTGSGGNKSKIKYTPTTKTLVLTLGGGTAGPAGVPVQTITYTPSPSMTDLAGNAIGGAYSFGGQRF